MKTTVQTNGKTYDISKDGIKSPTNLIVSVNESLAVTSEYHVQQCKNNNVDADSVRFYVSPEVNGRRYNGDVYVPVPVAVEYDKYITAAIAIEKENRANSIEVHLSTRGWGDYSSLNVTIDRRDNDKIWLDAAKKAFEGVHDVDHPNQTDDELLEKINAAVEKFDAVIARSEAEAKRVADLKSKAVATGEKQLLNKYMDECNDPNEECSTDSVSIYAMPDGTICESRQHTL